MNAIGDATFALALVLLVWETGTLEFFGVFDQAGSLSSTMINLVALGLLGGAVAKSAQIPLHTWLPDAMEGPTPVSALIHAATMVTAGVYLLVRAHPIFELAVDVQHLAAILGTVTLLVGRPHRARPVGHQARHRLLDDVADRLHVPRGRDRRVRLRDLPPDDARLLQGAALHVRRRRHPPPRRGAGHPPDGRPEGRAPADAHRLPRRHARARRHPDLRRLLVEGRDHLFGARDRRRARAGRCTSRRSSARSSPAPTRSASTSPSSTGRRAEPRLEAAHARARPRRGPAARCSSRSASSPCSRPSAGSSSSPASGSRSLTGSTRRPSRSSQPTVAQDYLTSAIAVALGARRALSSRGARSTQDRQLVPQPEPWRVLEHKLYFDELYDALFYRPAVALADALRRTCRGAGDRALARRDRLRDDPGRRRGRARPVRAAPHVRARDRVRASPCSSSSSWRCAERC